MLPIASPARARAWTWRELAARRGALAATAATGMVAAAVSIVPMYLLGALVDRVRDGDTAGLAQLVAVIVVAALVGGLATGLSSYLVNRVGEGLLADLREQVMDRALRIPATVIERGGRGDLLSRVGADARTIGVAVSDVLPTMVNGILLGALTLVGITSLDWRLGLAGAVAIPAYVIGLRWYLPRSAPLYAVERAALAAHAQVAVESMQGARTVTAYGARDAHVDAIDVASGRVRDLSMSIFTLFTRLVGRANRAEFLGLSAILVAAFLLARADVVTVGQATAAALLFHRLFNPVGMVLYNFDEIQAAAASLARLVGVLDVPVAATSDVEPPVAAGPLDIDVHGVSFAYDDGPEVVHRVSLHVPAGTRLALVGSTGAGKSTLAGLVAGLLTPTAGDVRVGGVPVAEVTGRRRLVVATVTQEVHVFAGTILDDLRLADASATVDDAFAALRRVGAQEWVRALPDGIDTVVGEHGHPLTAAQAQHLALARLVLAGPAVVILDEATAEAGSSHARELERAALAATTGCTTLVVAHRLTQAATADAVAVMADGRIVETGTHDELLAAGGRYANLWGAWQSPGC
jgi:ATP-binding cassette, subfamily C, bacterial